jgi:putative transposase
MPRQKRYRIPDIPQHLTARGNDRKPCFFSPPDYRRYLQLLQEASLKYHCEVHAYVLMTNHVHLLVTPRVPDGISLMMQAVGRRYVQQINALYGRTGTLFEGRYKATVVSSGNYVLQCYRYIELNPVRARMVADPSAYPWSSHGYNALGRGDPVLTGQQTYLRLGSSAISRRSAYIELVREGLSDDDLEQIRTSTRMGRPMGNSRFKVEIEKALRRRVPCNTWGGARISSGRKSTGLN